MQLPCFAKSTYTQQRNAANSVFSSLTPLSIASLKCKFDIYPNISLSKYPQIVFAKSAFLLPISSVYKASFAELSAFEGSGNFFPS